MPTYAKYVPRKLGVLGDMLNDWFGMRYEDVAVEWELVRRADKI
jgi:hypothetical protein